MEEPDWGQTFEKLAVGEGEEKRIRHAGCFDNCAVAEMVREIAHARQRGYK